MEIENRKGKVIVIMPAYNAEKTLEKTFSEIPKHCVDDIILVDDASNDRTVEIARKLKIDVIVHGKNRGYGGKQKTCYVNALKKDADIVVMVHPDYQYEPAALPRLIAPIIKGEAEIVLGSRMVNKSDALKGGMPLYKFCGNIFLTTLENIVFQLSLSEYHTGLRAYSRSVLDSIDFQSLSEDYVFDTEIIAKAVNMGFKISDIPIMTRYQDDSSSISFRNCIIYGMKTLKTLYKFSRNSRS